MCVVPEKGKIYGPRLSNKGGKSGSDDVVDGRSGGRRMRRRRTPSTEFDFSVVATPPHTGLLRHHLVLVHLRLLSGEVRRI